MPPSLLSNEDLMEKLAVFSLPIVRIVDYFAGATNAMRCDVTCSKDSSVKATMLYAHKNLEPCVGECIVAFCCSVLANAVVSNFNLFGRLSSETESSIGSSQQCQCHSRAASRSVVH